jgi:hypothetical protein
MRRRGISRAEVVRTILRPGQVVPTVKGRMNYQRLMLSAGRLLLRVVVAESPAAYHVVTAYKTRKVAKYWRNP